MRGVQSRHRAQVSLLLGRGGVTVEQRVEHLRAIVGVERVVRGDGRAPTVEERTDG